MLRLKTDMPMTMKHPRASSLHPFLSSCAYLATVSLVILYLQVQVCQAAPLEALKELAMEKVGGVNNTKDYEATRRLMLHSGSKNLGSLRGSDLGSTLSQPRGGSVSRSRGSTTTSNSNSSNNDSENVHDKDYTDQDEIVRVMVDCNDAAKEGAYACKNRILESVPPGTLRIIHYLQTCNAYSVEVKLSHLGELEGVQEDPQRVTMHLPDSIKVIHKRELKQTGDQVTPYGVSMVKAIEVWDQFQTKGENVRVCVVDSGVDLDHEDLDQLSGYEGNDLVQPWWRDAVGHGTHVTGTIAASDNGFGVVGVAPDVEVFVTRVVSANGGIYSSDVIAALEACRDEGANVVSMSLGGLYYSEYEQATLRSFYESDNIVTVAAAGNSGGTELQYPASYEYVLSVAAVDSFGQRGSFSTRNGMVDVAAPGVEILSTWADGDYSSINGTSMACPHVSGVVALMRSAYPSATPADIFAAIKSTAENPNTAPGQRDNDLGYGIINALEAVNALADAPDVGDEGDEGDGTEDGPGGSLPDEGTGGDGGGDGDGGDSDTTCVPLIVTVQTDLFGYENSHWLECASSPGNFVFFLDDFESFSTYQESLCVDPSDCCLYTILDEFGDGIAGEGVEIAYDDEVVYAGGSFGYGGYLLIGDGCPSE